MKKFFAALLALLLLTSGLCLAETAPSRLAVEEIRTQIGDNYVSYPQIKDMEDTAIQTKINDDIVLSAGVTEHLLTLVTLGDSSWGLRVSYQVLMNRDGVLSLLIEAEGKMPNGRQGQTNTALTYDLSTGERLSLNALFADSTAAVSTMEEWAEVSLQSEMTGYTEHNAVSPLPVDSFTLDEDGLTFWYAADQLQWLSGYSGACQFRYDELQNLLLTDQDGLPARLGLLEKALSPEEAAELIAKSAAEGRLPHLPVALGDAIPQITEDYRLSRTPDAFPGGRYFVLEAPAFRDVFVISDNLTGDDAHSVVEGIQQRRGGLAGLMIGTAVRQDWQAILGQPQETQTMSENMAYDYGLPAGQYDLYLFGENELRLYADENGVLSAIQLGKHFGG